LWQRRLGAAFAARLELTRLGQERQGKARQGNRNSKYSAPFNNVNLQQWVIAGYLITVPKVGTALQRNINFRSVRTSQYFQFSLILCYMELRCALAFYCTPHSFAKKG